MSGEAFLVLLSVAALEALLSGDNALVLAVMVKPLPPELRRKALFYGILGAYLLRGLALLFAVFLIRLWWVQVLGGLYLVYLMVQHFRDHPEAKPLPEATAGEFWRVVLLINLVDLAFAVDSILAVVAFSKDFLLVFLGVALGILFIRLLASSVVALMERFPGLEKVAYALVGWAGVKLLLEGTHTLAHLLHRPELALALPKGVFWGGTLLILLVGSLLAFRRHA
ncbi:integral membrane protein, YkoY family/integral membrane protein, YjbE family [Thermus arciformis]|uniref:Integral membrane protein, YkoY family/integral membrane protein, YjbE family n=1 Tax=Thermus arciformis TaxID=482827 RepID=A0A1G7H477_9DEIN|nr:TerC family protein [Thermus arciformis]SDE95113.1 integral membrane protein, YkoY family/integral membrane protein, YjbE family [Thermus arciformis]